MENNELIKCQYCGKQNKLEDTIKAIIISRNWEPSYRSPERNYCNNGKCAGHDQMAHEG